MAELALKVNSGANYADGDIIAAFNDRRIRCTHAQHICSVMNAGGGVGVHRDSNHVAKDFFELTHQYRFERIDRDFVRRIKLSDLSEEIFGSERRFVDGRWQHCDVNLHIAMQLGHHRHAYFGTAGAEVWYGGNKDMSNAAMDLVWNAIETKTANQEVNFKSWPCGAQDCKSHFFIAINNITDALAEELVVSGPGKAKRKHFVDFRNDIGLSAGTLKDIDDRSVEVRPRQDVKLDDSVIVKVRSSQQ